MRGENDKCIQNFSLKP